MTTLNTHQKTFFVYTKHGGIENRARPGSLIFDGSGTHVFEWWWTDKGKKDITLFPSTPPLFTTQNLNYKFLGCNDPENCCIYLQDRNKPENECVISTDEKQYTKIRE